MAGALSCSAGLALWQRSATTRWTRLSLLLGTVIMLLFAAALRLNAFLACVPLALAVLPSTFTRAKARIAAAALCASIAFLLVGPAVNALVQADKTGVELSLIIFDLGGITEHSGQSQFPELHVSNPVAVNHRCYDAYQWDSYSDWAKTACPLGFDAFQSAIDENDLHPTTIWLRAILAHPLAYAEHRLNHFNLSTWFLVPKGPRHTAWTQSVPNPWGYQVRQGALLITVNAITEAAGLTPIGWPIFWIVVGVATLILGGAARASAQAMAITASGTLYGLGFLVFGVATGMRYYMWTITGVALGAVLVAGELLRRWPDVSRRAVWAALVVVIVPTSLASVARLFF